MQKVYQRKYDIFFVFNAISNSKFFEEIDKIHK